MINIADNFNLAGSTKPLDSRDEFNTLAAMKACTVCNELHICYNKETQKQYQYNSSNTDDTTTGKWREYTPGGGGGEGTITGATVGGNPVTESEGVLQFPAYPTVPINKIKVDGESNDLPINDGRVVIPSTPVKGIQTSSGTTLNPDPNSGIVTLPAIPVDPTTRINNAEKRIAALESELGGDPTPVVIPVSAVNLPHTAGSTFTYDPDDTYVMNISDVQIATVCYPYDHTVGAATTSYLIFKAIDRDLYYVYTHNLSTNICTYFEEKVFDELSHNEAKAVFEAGKYAVKQVIDVRHTGNPLPEGYFKHGIPSVFVTPDGYPLRYNQIKENNVYYILLKCDENNKIFKYSASNGKWSLVLGGCYTKGDTTTGADYEKYDAYFDKKTASDIPYNDTNSLLNVSTVQQAIQKLAIGIGDGVSTVRILLKKNNEQVIANQQVNITVTYQGEPFDLTTQESYNDGFYTGANGIVELLLPLGAVYNITYSNFNDDYSTPDSISGIVDRPILNITGLYVAISENESILFVVNVLGADASVRPTDKEIYVDIYNQQNTPIHTYTCVLASNGTPKTIKDASNNVIKTGTSNVTLDLAKNVKFRARLQLWDTTLTEEEQSYIASGAQERTTRATRFTMYFSYQNTQTGLFLVVKDSSKVKGFAEYKITNIDTTNNIINISIEGVDYTITKDSNNIIYKKETADSSVQPSQWFTVAESADILGIGCRTSTLIAAPVVDQPTNDLGFTNCCFIVPRTFIQKVDKHQNTIIDNTYFDCWSNTSGIHQTRQLSKIEGTMVSPVAQNIIANNVLTLSTPNGNISINGFACSTSQFTAFVANINNIFFLLRFINGSSLSLPLSIATNCYVTCIDGGNNPGTTMTAVTSYTANLVWQSGWNSPTQDHTFFVFYPF